MKVLMIAINAKYIHSSLALRYIQKYCEKYNSNITKLELTINHSENEILRSIYNEKPDIIAFSCYIWNMQLIESLIPTLAKILPGSKIILGGPEVSYSSEELFDKYPQIDIVIEGEGEQTWYELMQYYVDNKNKIDQIRGIVYKDITGTIKRNPDREPMDLNKIPFVYDDISDLKNKIIYYEATRGCPFSCQYCLSSVERGVRFLSLERVFSDLQFFLNKEVKQVKFVDRTFNCNPNYAIQIWDYLKKHDNGITNFHFEIAADLISDKMLEFLKDTRPTLFQFEIGVQSTNPEVLDIIQRTMNFDEVTSIVKKIKSYKNIHQHLDLIAGLPKEDMKSFRKSFNDVIKVRPEQLQLGFLKVLKGSGMCRDAKKYGLVYKDIAPYEILYTSHISYDEMLHLHLVEEMLERYYNSGRFTYSLEYLFTLFDTPFDLFSQIALFWERHEYNKIKHSKNAYYEILLEFAKGQSNIDIVLMQELLRLDMFLHEKLKDTPQKLITINQEQYKSSIRKFYNEPGNIEYYLPQLKDYTIQQVGRMSHIEVFSVDIFSCINTKTFSNISRKTTPILFNYHMRDPLTNNATYYCVELDYNLELS